MTRIESIIALLKANTGAKTISVTDVATYANYADSITLETISAGIMATSPLKAAFAGLPTADLLDQMFISLFGYTQAQVDELRATEAGAAGFQYWADEIANNSDMININTLAIALLNGAVAAEAAGNGTDGTKAAALVAADVAAYEIYAGETETPVETDGQTVYLTANQDILVGTDGNDTFIARGNNTLNNADIIDGGKGTDTVFVMLDKGETAESPELTNVEILKVQVQATTDVSGDNEVDTNTRESNIDAGDMTSVHTYINDNSRADLTIEDVSRNSHITTLVMKETSSITSDYTVLFDPDNITGPGKSDEGATLVIDIVNLLSAANGESPVANFSTLDFKVGDVEIVVEIPVNGSYADLVAAIEAALAAKNILTVDVDMQVSSVAFNKDLGGYPKGYEVTYQQIVLTNNSSAKLVEGDIKLLDSSKKGDLFYDMNPEAGTETPSLTQTNVVFDRVGRSDTINDDTHLVQGGAFVAGSDAVSTDGIQQFNVSVDRDSWLTSVASTANKLEVMNIKNIAENSDGNGTLKIAGTTGQAGVTDVRVIDASGMTGKAIISAELTADVVSKYLNLTDDQFNAAADNSELNYLKVTDTYFSYDFGSNNDTFNLTIDGSNLAAAGTTTREDFIMEINGGAGNDTITVDITNMTANAYANSQINANLAINGGEDNDTIWTKGDGDFKIDAGTGADTVYTDNTGAQAGITTNDGKAVWVLNSVDRDIEDLTSEAAESITGVNLQVTVSFNGFEKTVTVADSVGATATKTITDLQINQAIKDAINNDDVLSKLLVAQDGPSRSLIIESLIDGDQTNNLTYTFTNTALTTAQTTAGVVLANTASFANGDYDKAINAVTNAINATEGVVEVLEVQTIDLTGGFAAIADGDTVSLLGDTQLLAVGDTAAIANDAGFAAYVAANITAAGWTVTANGAVLTLTQTAGNGSNAAAQALAADGTAGTAFAIAAETVTDGVVGGATAIIGADSTAVSDNIITAGTGNDVIVLGTDVTALGGVSNDTIVFKGYNLGNDTIVNFADGAAAAGGDKLDFTEYLGGAAAAGGAVDASTGPTTTFVDKVVYTSVFTESATSTKFDSLTADIVQAALNNTAANTANNTAGIDKGYDGSTTVVTNNILMIENANNLGEYKIFDLNSTATSTDFTVELIGTVDFGATQSFTGDNLA